MHRFSLRERFITALGLLVPAFAGLVGLIRYGLGPLLSGEHWKLASPGVHLVSTITRLLLVWLRLMQATFQGVQ